MKHERQANSRGMRGDGVLVCSWHCTCGAQGQHLLTDIERAAGSQTTASVGAKLDALFAAHVEQEENARGAFRALPLQERQDVLIILHRAATEADRLRRERMDYFQESPDAAYKHEANILLAIKALS